MYEVANNKQIALFKFQHCSNEIARSKMINEFNIKVESFEELIPGRIIRSYATGNREIENSFIMFEVSDPNNSIQYYPVFSETVGRNMLKSWGKNIPKKRSIFLEDSKEMKRVMVDIENKSSQININNMKLRSLILYARSLMILHIDDPRPMGRALKSIYISLESNQQRDVKAFEVKSINTAIGTYLKKPINTQNENFQNLQEYFVFLKNNFSKRKLRNYDFEELKDLFRQSYPNESTIYF